MSEAKVHWLAVHEEGGQPTFRIGRTGDALVAEWVGAARLVAHADGSSTFEADPSAWPERVDKIRRGGAALLLRHLEGRIALHGAAVGRDGMAIALLGRSGQGKSTLAATLCARAGMALFADDALAVDEVDGAFMVVALEEDHWLDTAARAALGVATTAGGEGEQKAPVRAPPRDEARANLVAIVDLGYGEVRAPVLARLDGLDAVGRLLPQAVRFAIDDGARHVRELDALAALVSRVPVYALERPRHLGRIGDAVALLEPLFRAQRIG